VRLHEQQPEKELSGENRGLAELMCSACQPVCVLYVQQPTKNHHMSDFEQYFVRFIPLGSQWTDELVMSLKGFI
jgi:hypothetical protein